MIYDDFVFAGHGVVDSTGAYDPGAAGNGYKENDLTRLIAKKVVEIKKAAGINTHYAEQNYENRNCYGNSYKSKAGVSIHINAGGGAGSEIFVPQGERFLETELSILERFNKEVGLKVRGIKSRDYYTEEYLSRINGYSLQGKDYYKEIREAWEQGISLSIVEVGFIDNAEDVNLIKNNIDKIALIIAQETAKLIDVNIEAPAVKPPAAAQTTTGSIKRVIIDGKQVGAYRNNDNIIEEVKRGLEGNASKIEVSKV